MPVQLIFNDCMPVMKDMNASTYDLILCDPGQEYYRKHKNNEIHKWLFECTRLLKRNGSILIFSPFNYIDRVISSMLRVGFTRKQFKNMLIWHKNNFKANGQYRTLNDACDYILWFTKGDNYFFDYEFGRSIIGKSYHNNIDFPICSYMESIKNEAGNVVCDQQKPINLFRFLIRVFCPPDGYVLDPFSGTATSLIACKENNRNGIGIENNADIFWHANERISK